jgi:hypothetical protein
MALVGGGGAGNTAGSNPSGTSTNLNYVGEHSYAYSGDVTVGGSLTTMLEFTTSNQYIVGNYQIHGAFAQIGNDQVTVEVVVNGESVVHTFWTFADENLSALENNILLPPYSTIRFQLAQASASDRTMQLTFQGRVYNA